MSKFQQKLFCWKVGTTNFTPLKHGMLYSKEIHNRSDEYYLESAVLFLDGGHRIFNYSHLDWIYVCQTGLNCFVWPFILVSLAFLFQTLFPLCRGYSSYLFCDHNAFFTCTSLLAPQTFEKKNRRKKASKICLKMVKSRAKSRLFK